MFKAVNKSVSSTGYQAVGKDLVVKVMFLLNPLPFGPFLTVESDGEIVQGLEDGEVLTIRVFGDTFIKGTVDAADVTITTLPTGVEKGSLVYVDSNTARLTLSGNATTNYADTSITLTVDNTGLTTLGSSTLTTAATAIFKNKNAAVAGMVNTITEGSENDKVIIVNLPTGFTFKDDAPGSDSLFGVGADSIMVTPGSASAVTGLAGLPAGIIFDAAALSVSDSVLTLTISANSTADYDVNQLVTFTIAKERLLKDGVASTVGVVGRTVIIATNEAAPAAPTSLVETDSTTNTLAFNIVTGFVNAENYEISIDGGVTWVTLVDNTAATGAAGAVGNALETGTPVTSITVFVGATAIAVGNVKVRLRAGAVAGSATLASVVRTPAGAIASSDAPYTAG
jgi:hypothetical protein